MTLTFVAALVAGCGDRPATQDSRPANSAQVPSAQVEAASSTEPAETNDVAPLLTTEQIAFGDKWKAAALEERRMMADVAKVGMMFQGASKNQIDELFGEATQSGVDAFGEDVLRYELGAVPEADGGGQYHLTFVFETNVVVRVMGNFFSISP